MTQYAGDAVAAGTARIVAAGAAYFALVFAAGFILGSIRVPLLVPRFGERAAELMEAPFMFAVIVFAARRVARRYALAPRAGVRLGVGGVALGLMLAAEFVFILVLQRRSIGAYLAEKDAVAGAVFLAMLAVFALAPFVLGQMRLAREGQHGAFARMDPLAALRAIKLLHTLIWAFFVGCIVAIPLFGHAGQYGVAGALVVVVAIEAMVVALNHGRCPLTDIAARYTGDRQDNFDIYLPVWLARYNKLIFGAWYVVGAAYALLRWWGGGAA